MTTVLACLLAGVAVLLWPPRPPPWPRLGRSGAPPVRSPPPGAGAGVRRPWRRRKQDEATTDDVADALVLVALGLRAGLPLTAALQHVGARSAGVVRDDLAAVVAALQWGLSAREAWRYAGPRWRPAATATHLSEQTGAAAAELLEGAATRMREEGERARERAAARAGVLLVLPLGLGFLPAFACTAVVPVVVTLASGVLGGSP